MSEPPAVRPAAGEAPTAQPVAGLLLAAGAGRRMGTPKALLHDEDAVGTGFLDRALRGLHGVGCDPLVVVAGAAAPRVGDLLAETGWTDRTGLWLVVAEDWAEGMGASLRAGLRSLLDDPGPAQAALVTLVDLPDVGPAVLRRVLAATSEWGSALVRATYDGRPGHPVLLGGRHWEGVVASARGDHGARDYLAAHPHVTCECADLASGRDVDRPEDLAGPRPGR